MTNSSIRHRQIHLLSRGRECGKQPSHTVQQPPSIIISNMGHKMDGTHNEILICLVRGLPLLLPSTHKSSTRDNVRFDLGKVNLDHHAFLASIFVPDFCYSVTRASYFEEHLALHVALSWSNHKLSVLGIASRTTSKIGLMLLALSVSQV